MNNDNENMVTIDNADPHAKLKKELQMNIINNNSSNSNDLISKSNSIADNAIKAQAKAAANPSTTEVTGGDIIIHNGKLYEVHGYIDVNGKKSTIFADVNSFDDIFNGKDKYIYNKKGELEKVVNDGIDKVKIGGDTYGIYKTEKTLLKDAKTTTVSENEQQLLKNNTTDKTISISKISKDGNSSFSQKYDGKSITKGSTVVVNGKTLQVSGYVVDDYGQKRIIYIDPTKPWYQPTEYYVGKDGKLHTTVFMGGGGASAYTIDGKVYKTQTTQEGDSEFEPSIYDKQWLGYENQESNAGSEAPTEAPSENPTQPAEYINTNIALNFGYKRARYYIKYSCKKINKNHKAGPYDTPERRTVAIETYKNTPGLGITAQKGAENFERHIARIRYILENDVFKYSKSAVIKNNNSLGTNEIVSIISSLGDIPITVFRRFSANMPRVIRYADLEQNKANKKKYQEVEKMKYVLVKNYRHSAEVTKEYDKEKDEYPEITSSIDTEYIKDNFASYNGYLKGNEIPILSTSTSSKRPGGKVKQSKSKDIYVNKKNILRIIDDLDIVLSWIKKAKDNIKTSVATINKIPGYKQVGAPLSAELIGGPLLDLEKRIKKLKAKYEHWLSLVKKYDTDPPTDPKKKKDGTSNNPIKPTTETPTETPTEQPTERPTEEVTQPTTPPTSTPVNPNPTPSGGDNSNGGGGNYSYTGDGGGETVTEAPTTVTEPTSEDVIVEGNSYKLPTSSKPATPTNTTTNSGGGNSAIPVLAGLAAAAAAGIGAKAYIDRKNNRDNEESEEFKAEDWSGDTDMNMEYQEPEDRNAETLDYDEPGYQEEETERYGARSNQDMENLQ